MFMIWHNGYCNLLMLYILPSLLKDARGELKKSPSVFGLRDARLNEMKLKRLRVYLLQTATWELMGPAFQANVVKEQLAFCEDSLFEIVDSETLEVKDKEKSANFGTTFAKRASSVRYRTRILPA